MNHKNNVCVMYKIMYIYVYILFYIWPLRLIKSGKTAMDFAIERNRSLIIRLFEGYLQLTDNVYKAISYQIPYSRPHFQRADSFLL